MIKETKKKDISITKENRIVNDHNLLTLKKYRESSKILATQKKKIKSRKMIVKSPFIRLQTLELRKEILSLVKHCIKIHKTAIKALSDADKKNALIVLRMDNEIDVRYSEILKNSTFLLAQQPLGIELRRVIGYIEIAKSLEWIGNCSVKIAKFIIAFKDEISKSSQTRIKKVHSLLYSSMKKISELIESEEIDDVIKLSKKDDIIDEKVLRVSSDIINSIARKGKINLIDERVYVIKILNSLEIAADHIVDICEIILYIATGVVTDLN